MGCRGAGVGAEDRKTPLFECDSAPPETLTGALGQKPWLGSWNEMGKQASSQNSRSQEHSRYGERGTKNLAIEASRCGVRSMGGDGTLAGSRAIP